MIVNTETRKLLAKEIPWLPRLLPEDVTSCQFKVIDLHVLLLRPSREKLHSQEGSTTIKDHGGILFLSDSGLILGKVGEEEVDVPRRRWFRSTVLEKRVKYWDENVGEAIKRLDLMPWFQYILAFECKHSDRIVTVYKPSKKYRTMREQFDALLVPVQKEINDWQQEVPALDAVEQ